MSEEVNKNSYSADSIQALEGMEHVRMRPSMYIGDVGLGCNGCHTLANPSFGFLWFIDLLTIRKLWSHVWVECF